MSLLDLIPGVSQAKLAVSAAVGVALLLGVGFVEYKVYSTGYDHASAKYISKINEIEKVQNDEHIRQAGIVQESLNNIKNRVETLQATNDELEKELKSVQDQAAKSATAANDCLNADSVSRLNNLGKSHRKTNSITPKL